MINKINNVHRVILLLGLLIMLIATISSSSAASTIYVNNATGNDLWDGTNDTPQGGNVGPKATIQNGTDAVDNWGIVYVANGTYKEHVIINKNLTLIGQNQTGTIIDGTYNGRPLTIESGINVSITNITIQNGNITGTHVYGGGIFNSGGSLTLTNCNVTNNTATAIGLSLAYTKGGGIYNSGDSLTLTNCNVVNNTATATADQIPLTQGGGIFNSGGSLTLTNCNVVNNTVTATSDMVTAIVIAYGGGIFNYGGSLTLTNCDVVNNTATATGADITTAYGGGIANSIGSLTLTNCDIVNNTAIAIAITLTFAEGGGIFNAGSLTANFNRIVGNTPTAIHNTGTIVSVEDNWWGSNDPEFNSLFVGVTHPTNWLYMTINATPSTVNNTQSSTVTVSFNNYSTDGINYTPLPTSLAGHIPNGTPVTFSLTNGPFGTLTAPLTVNTMDGIASIVFKASQFGVQYVNGTLDNQNVTASITINPASNLFIKITSSKKNPKVGETFTLTYKLGNYGPDNATNVTITIHLPKGFILGDISGDGNWTYNAATRTITWTLKNVPVGDPYLYIPGWFTKAGTYMFSASISSDTYNIDTEGVKPITINAAEEERVGMQKTGLPINYLIIAILMVISGYFIPKRK